MNNPGLHWLNSVNGRLHRANKNWLCIICGGTGSGKSYSALSIAQYLVKERNNKYYVVFEPGQFLDVLNSPDLKRGDIIIFDEAGVGMASRSWYSIQNKLLGCVLQTFRNLNIGVIFTTPDLSFIDVQARKLFHNYLLTKKINIKEEKAYLKVYNIVNDALTGKTFLQEPSYYDNRESYSLDILEIPKPLYGLEDYEAAAAEYKARIRHNAKSEIDKYNLMRTAKNAGKA